MPAGSSCCAFTAAGDRSREVGHSFGLDMVRYLS
jgi:hypothetical protein